jgi:hypothetical protein
MEEDWVRFVNEAEEAISREHTEDSLQNVEQGVDNSIENQTNRMRLSCGLLPARASDWPYQTVCVGSVQIRHP